MEWVKGQEDLSPETASVLIQSIAIIPGWSEKNFQVRPANRDAVPFLGEPCSSALPYFLSSVDVALTIERSVSAEA